MNVPVMIYRKYENLGVLMFKVFYTKQFLCIVEKSLKISKEYIQSRSFSLSLCTKGIRLFHKKKPLLFQPNVPRTFFIDTFLIRGGSVLTDIGIGSNCGLFHANHSLYSYKTDHMLGLSRKAKRRKIFKLVMLNQNCFIP